MSTLLLLLLFFFNDTATTEIYTLSLHDALPIFEYWKKAKVVCATARMPQNADVRLADTPAHPAERIAMALRLRLTADRKSTRLNSSHTVISYAVFCLKKKKNRYTKKSCEKQHAT